MFSVLNNVIESIKSLFSSVKVLLSYSEFALIVNELFGIKPFPLELKVISNNVWYPSLLKYKTFPTLQNVYNKWGMAKIFSDYVSRILIIKKIY